MLACALNLDDAALVGAHEVQVNVGMAVLGVVEVKKRPAVHNTGRDRGDLAGKGQAVELVAAHEAHERIVQRDPRARDGCRARAAVGLDHVAVDGDGNLAELLHAHDAAQASADEALDLHAATLARAVLALRPARRRRGEHGVLGGDPTAAVARAAPLGHSLLDGRAAQDARVAELGEARPGGGLDHVVGELDGAHLVHGAAKAALAMLVG